MLTRKVIQKWFELRGEDGMINDHWIASLAQRHKDVAEAYEQGFYIEELLTKASIASNNKSPEGYRQEFINELARVTDGPEAAQLILDEAKRRRGTS